MKKFRAVAWLRLSRTFLFIVTSIFAGQAFAQRAIPEDNLAYPVLITIKRDNKTFGMASGFYLTTERALYLVTAKHVLSGALSPDPATQKIPDTELELLSYSKDQPNPKRILLKLNLTALKESGAVRIHASQDVGIVRLAATATTATIATTTTASNDEGKKSNSFLPGVMAQENAEGAVLGVALAAVKTFDQVLVGNGAIMYGYPVSLGLPRQPQFESDRPLLRKALVAGQDTQKRTIILDGPSYPGNSGGPVFQIERNGATTHFNLIGVIVSHIPLLRGATDQHGELQLLVGFNSGYSVAEPMDFVLELVNQDVAEQNGPLRIADAPVSQAPKAQRKAPVTASVHSKRRPDARAKVERPHRRDAANR